MDRISVEHKDLSGHSHLALNKSGTLGLIVGRLSMGLVNLDKPERLINRVKRNTSKYEVEEIQFSRGSETLCAVAAGKKVGKLPTDYGRPMKPFFIKIPNFWTIWVDKFFGEFVANHSCQKVFTDL